MSKEEWLQLQLGDYIYRTADGWGGYLTSAPSSYDNSLKFPENQYLSFRGIVYMPKNFKTHQLSANSNDHHIWEKMDIETCNNALALSRYTLMQNLEIMSALRNTTIL